RVRHAVEVATRALRRLDADRAASEILRHRHAEVELLDVDRHVRVAGDVDERTSITTTVGLSTVGLAAFATATAVTTVRVGRSRRAASENCGECEELETTHREDPPG